MQDLQLLTCDEVARLLRVSAETVRQLATAGDLPGRKVGRAWRFPQKAIEKYILAGAGSTVAALPADGDAADRVEQLREPTRKCEE